MFNNKLYYYKQKLLKYQIKIQLGGSSGFVFNLDEWKSISNLGGQNCGIFLSEKYPEYIIKCDNIKFGDGKVLDVNYINSKFPLFPTIINTTNIENNTYIVMQKLNGDITSIFFNLIPNQILDNDMYREQKDNIYKLFRLKLKDYLSLSDEIKDIKTVSFKLYDKFMMNLLELWELYYPIIIKEMIRIKLLLFTLGYQYYDNKFDNYGYILSDTPNHELSPKLFDKYFHVYFIDWESGLSPVNKNDLGNVLNNNIIKDINNGVDYDILNGFNFRNIFKKYSSSDELDPDINSILQKEYNFDISKFKHSFTNITDVEHYILGGKILNIQYILDHGYSHDILEIQKRIEQMNDEKELRRKTEKLASRDDFIKSGQDINHFDTYILVSDEIKRLDMIKDNRETFLTFGIEISDHITLKDLEEECSNLDQIKILAKHPLFIASGKNIKDFLEHGKAYHERRVINLKDDLMHSKKFKESGINIDSINFSNLTIAQIKKYEDRYREWD
jgi:hypothetical protein